MLGRRFVPGEIGWGYARNLVDTLGGAGRADPADLDRWLAGLQRLADRGAFLFSVNDYAVICVECPGDADRPMGSTVRRPTSR